MVASGGAMTDTKSSTLVSYERDGRIVTLTLERPEKLNAFSDELVGGFVNLV